MGELGVRVGRAIRARRKAKGLTAEELGAALGLEGQSARTSVWRWEQGQRLGLDTIDRIAYALDCEPWELFKNDT